MIELYDKLYPGWKSIEKGQIQRKHRKGHKKGTKILFAITSVSYHTDIKER